MGALASEFWFLAFAIATAANVRTLALVEVLFAQGGNALHLQAADHHARRFRRRAGGGRRADPGLGALGGSPTGWRFRRKPITAPRSLSARRAACNRRRAAWQPERRPRPARRQRDGRRSPPAGRAPCNRQRGRRPRDAALRHAHGLAIDHRIGRLGGQRHAGNRAERGQRQRNARKACETKHDNSSREVEDCRHYFAAEIIASMCGRFRARDA